MDSTTKNRTRSRVGTLAKLTVGAAALALAAPAPSAAAAETHAPATVTGQFECGIASCSYVFTKNATRTIANDGLAAAGLCGAIPTPGNGVCAAAFAVVVVTAKVAKGQGKCAKLNFAKIAPFPSWTSVDGGSHCH